MHLVFPRPPSEDYDECGARRFKTTMINLISPPTRDTCRNRRYFFSMFYTTAHVFAFMNTIVYWGVLVPAGHGGFKTPKLPSHGHKSPDGGEAFAAYDPSLSQPLANGLVVCR